MIIAAIALAAAAPSSAPPAKVAEEEFYCAYEHMTDAELDDASKDVMQSSLTTAATTAAVAGKGAADTCAAKYKWSNGERNSATLFAATAHALDLMQFQMKGRYEGEKLGKLFDALSFEDQKTLLFDAAPVSEADHLAAYKRFDAAATKAGVAKADYPMIGQFLTLFARSLHAQAMFVQFAQKKPQ
jgi:hypothetical protein